MTERRILINDMEQKIYDGFVDYARDISHDDLFQPGQGDGKGFSPFAYIIDRLFRDTLQTGPVADEEEAFRPNAHFKRPAYYAALDLLMGNASRGTTDLIDQWQAGGHCMLSGHQVSRAAIIKTGTRPRYVAIAHEGLIYYEWGALPGHRFPETAIALYGREWERIAKALSEVRKFERGSFLYRKRTFAKFEQLVQSDLPKTSRVFQIYTQHGTIGLLKMFFGSRWEAAIEMPDMSKFKGRSHSYVKDSINSSFCLCSMDDAVHHKLSVNDCAIHDLTSRIILKGEQ